MIYISIHAKYHEKKLIDLSIVTTKNKHAVVNYSPIKDSLRETGISVCTGKQIKSYSITKRALEANVF